MSIRQSILRFSRLLSEGRRVWIWRTVFALVILIPFLHIVWCNQTNLRREATDSIYVKRQALARLSAAIVNEKLNSLVHLGLSLATRPLVVERVAKGDWPGAINVLGGVLDNFPFLDRLVLYDTDSIIRADMPPAVPSVVGQSRADKEWSRDLRKAGSPIVSNIYQRGAERIFGYTSAEALGQPATILHPEEGCRDEMQKIIAALMRGERIAYFETRRRCKDGKVIDVSMTVSPIRGISGDITGASIISWNITEEKRLASEREKLLADLSASLENIRNLRGLLPICASCKRIRDDKGYWNQIEVYIRDHSEAEFNLGLYPECIRKLYPDFAGKL